MLALLFFNAILASAVQSDIKAGIKKYKTADYKGAIKTLQSAVGRIQVPAERAIAYLYLGCAHLGNLQKPESQRAFRQAFRLKPDLDLPPDMQDHPKIAPLFKKVRQQSTAELTIQVSLPQAQIWLDNHTVGTGAITLRVFASNHLVKATYLGKTTQKSVQLNSGGSKTLTLEIPPIIQHTTLRSIAVNQPIPLTVQLVSRTAPEIVGVYYTQDRESKWRNLRMTLINLSRETLRTYQVTLPAQSHVGTLRYYIQATYPRNVQVQDPEAQGHHQITLVDNTPPQIGLTPTKHVRVNESIRIEAQIQDDTSIKRAEAYYVYSKSRFRWSTAFQRLSLVQTSPGRYTASLPPQREAGYIRYYVKATDEGNNVSYYPADGAKASHYFPVIDDTPVLQKTITELEQIDRQAYEKREKIRRAIQQAKAHIRSADKAARVYQYEKAETVAAKAKTLLDTAQRQATELSELSSSVSDVVEKGHRAVTFSDSRDRIDEKAKSLRTTMGQANPTVTEALNEVHVALEQVNHQLESRGGLELRITVNDKIASESVKVSLEYPVRAWKTVPNRFSRIANIPVGTQKVHIELSHWLTADMRATIKKGRDTVLHHNFRSGTLRVQIPDNDTSVFLDGQRPSFLTRNNVAVFEYVNMGTHQLQVIDPGRLPPLEKGIVIDSTVPVEVDARVGTLELRITPTRAAVFLDNQAGGYGSRAFPQLRVGWHSITVNAEGYGPQRIMVNIQAGKTLIRTIHLSSQ